jgi:transposase
MKKKFAPAMLERIYLLRTGCQWRNLPKDLPPWPTVYDYLRHWERAGLIAAIHTHLREHIRLREGRRRQPSAGIVDSQERQGQRRRAARVATTRARRSTAPSGTSWWTPWGCF